MLLHRKTLFMPACHPRKKISFEKKLSNFPLLHSCTLHTLSSASKYNSKIYSIDLDHFPLGQIRNKSIQPQLWVGSFCLGQIRNKLIQTQIRVRLFSFFLYSHTFSHSNTVFVYHFTQLRKLIITYLYIIHKCFHTHKDGGWC